MGGAGVSEANGVLRNHYHPPGATIYIEKRLTNQSYRLFSLYLYLLLNIGLLFSVSFKSALKEADEAFDREVIASYRNEHFSVRGEEYVVRLGVYIPLRAGKI